MKKIQNGLLILGAIGLCFIEVLQAADLPTSGTLERVVVLAKFKGDQDAKSTYAAFDSFFNGGTEPSMKSYFNAISNGQLTVSSHLYPRPDPGSERAMFELNYCHYCYENQWAATDPSCKGKGIATLTDVSIGYILQDLVQKLEDSGQWNSGLNIDSNNDGEVDQFVILLQGNGRGKNKGIHSMHQGKVSERFTKAHGDILLNGKKVINYLVTYEQASLDTHCRLLLSDLGFPPLYRTRASLLRAVGAWDPMDGPSLSYPLVYNRWKYSHQSWITEIPEITKSGIYKLEPSTSTTHNAFKIKTNQPNEYWVLEYRNKNNPFEAGLPQSGLLVYRVDDLEIGSKSANPEVYVYRLDGTASVLGDLSMAPFSDLLGRSSFDACTNPAPFLKSGEMGNLAISSIAEQENELTFDVQMKFNSVHSNREGDLLLYPNPVSETLFFEGCADKLALATVGGAVVWSLSAPDEGTHSIDVSRLSKGVYVFSIEKESECRRMKVIIN